MVGQGKSGNGGRGRMNMPPFPQSLIPFELKIHPKGPLRSQKWHLVDGKILRKIIPSIPSSTQHFKEPAYLEHLKNKSKIVKQDKVLSEAQLKYFRMKRIMPLFDSQFRHHGISGLTLRQKDELSGKYIGITPASVNALNRIFKEARNLTSLTLEPRCELSTFKAINKIHKLKNLTLKITTNQILAYPQLFKGLNRLQRVNLIIQSLEGQNKYFHDMLRSCDGRCGPEMIPMMSKFFGFLLDSPNLEHINVRLEGCEDYYKILLEQIHQKKLSSFHIMVYNAQTPPESSLPWTNYIESLYLCFSTWKARENPDMPRNNNKRQKRLSLFGPWCFANERFDQMERSETLKNLYVVGNPELGCVQKFLGLMSNAKALESLKLEFEASDKKQGETLNDFINQIFKMESVETLQSLTCHIKNRFYAFPGLPYNVKMRNLKSLQLALNYLPVVTNISYLAESLKYLASLETFHLHYSIGKPGKTNTKGITCNFPSGGLKRLKSFSLTCSRKFSEISANQLADCIMEIPGLKSLFVSSNILKHLEKNKGETLTESLRSKESLEDAEFAWKEKGRRSGTQVSMKRAEKELVVTSKSFV